MRTGRRIPKIGGPVLVLRRSGSASPVPTEAVCVAHVARAGAERPTSFVVAFSDNATAVYAVEGKNVTWSLEGAREPSLARDTEIVGSRFPEDRVLRFRSKLGPGPVRMNRSEALEDARAWLREHPEYPI